MKKLFLLVAVLSSALIVVTPLTAQRAARSLKRPIIPVEKTIKFGPVEAFSEGNGVFVRWQMDVETDNVCFFVYRINVDGQTLVSEQPVLASRARFTADATYGEEYSYFDPSGSVGDVYLIESLDAGGKRLSSSKAGAVYTYDLASVAGRSSQELLNINDSKRSRVYDTSLVLPKALRTEVEQSQLVPDPSAQRAIAAKPGVKLGIRADGFYRVSRAELQGAGFNVGTDPGLWQLYCDGVEHAITVGGNGAYIEFLARANETIESDIRYYFLVVGDTWGKRMQTTVSRPIGVPVASKNYAQTSYLKERIYYINDILNGDAENFWGSLVTSTSVKNLNFSLTGIDTLGDTATVEIRLQGFSLTNHSVSLLLNGHSLSPAVGTNATPLGLTATVPVSYLIEGTNVLGMMTGAAGDYVFFDSISVSYARRFQASSDQIAFYTTSYRSATVSGFSAPNVRLFDTTQDGLPVEVINLKVAQNGATYDLNLPANRGRRLYAVSDTAARTVASIEANVPSTLSMPGHRADLVIISYPDFLNQASVWSRYRQRQGVSVEIVDIRDIYDEFDYGQSSSDSIRAFLEYATSNWQIPPRYVLLLGDSTYDPKNYEGHGYQNYVPTEIVNTVYMETGSDEALADFNGDGLAEVAIGRIPANIPQDVTNAFTKVQGFEQPAMQNLNRGAIFAYDLPNGYDFAGMSATLRSNLPASMPTVMVDRGAPNSSATLVNEINVGRYIVNYSGHGTSTTWATSSFFGYLQVPNLTNANNQSIFTMLTCLNGYFINPNTDSLAERLLEATNGGSVIAWASTGKTTPDWQMAMGIRFYNQIGLGNITRIGDLIRDAKQGIAGGTDVRYSWVLLGDPMLKVR